MTNIEYRQMKDVDDALSTYRSQQVVATLLALTDMKIQVDAIGRLKDTPEAKSRRDEVAQEARGKTEALAKLEARMVVLRKLAGVSKDESPWDAVVSYLEAQLAQEEELHIRAVDQAANPEAYGYEPDMADYLLARATARVQAYHAELDLIASHRSKKPHA
jgi:hypothetical protein